MRTLLEATGRYRWLPHRQVVCVFADAPADGSPVVVDHLAGRHHGSLALLCIGDWLSGLGGRVGAALAGAPLGRCRLQMMQTAPTAERLTTAIADADSMRYYPAFDLPARAALGQARPETLEWGMQLLSVQRAAGGLTIGDTPAYDEPFGFAVEKAAYDRRLEPAESLLGWVLPLWCGGGQASVQWPPTTASAIANRSTSMCGW